tara:strand:- start:2728 stop:3093 length:366 start_codon:yes stop_codon:yes gene_type:complete
MGLKTNYKEGSLIRIGVHNNWTLGTSRKHVGNQVSEGNFSMQECPLPASEYYHPGFGHSYNTFEGKLGLIVKVIRNRLEQPMGYRVQIGEDIMLCKSVIAEKYFEPTGETTNDTDRGTSKV